MPDTSEIYMHRCIALARLAGGYTAPNPMVGAVLVFNDRIIGEGYHQHYGQAHSEVNCIASVKKEDREYISRSVLYVSLEPCAHFGKTPPCADLIIAHQIPKVVIGCRDPFYQVDGKGIEKLMAAGIDVQTCMLEKECMELNSRFFTFHIQQRPYIILKWAQSNNGKIGHADHSRAFISNAFTNRLVHQWRSAESAILVGTNTARGDNPSLNVRLWSGPDPVRLVIDRNLVLPASLHLFDGNIKTIVFNTHKAAELPNLSYYKLTEEADLLPGLMHALYTLQIQSVLVEGGATLLQSFIDAGIWDEARVITNEELLIPVGTNSPILKDHQSVTTEKIFSDHIHYYKKSPAR